MPTYEMPLLLRISNKAEYLNILRTVANSIFATGGFIRKIENWGDKELPCKALAHGTMNTRAAHFMIAFDVPPREIVNIQDNCKRNLSIIRSEIYKQNEPESDIQCTFEEEMLPPPYRPIVQKLIAAGTRNRKKKFEHNSGLDYYPFL